MDTSNLSPRRWPGHLLFGFLTLAAFGALVLTRPPRSGGAYRPGSLAARSSLVDESHLRTAQALASLASAPEEVAFARHARELADADVDLAFSIALREAQSYPAALSPEGRQIQARVNNATAQVQKDLERVSQLEKQLIAAGTHGRDALQDQLDLANAQLSLSQDQLSDAQQDLQRAGGDPTSRIQRLLQQHELARHDADPTVLVPPERKSSPAYGTSNLVSQATALHELRGKLSPLEHARMEILSGVVAVARMHDAVEMRAAQTSLSAREQTAGAKPSPGRAASTVAQAESLTLMRRQSNDEKTLADLSRRIEGQQQITETYGNWMLFVGSHLLAEWHGIIASVLWILIIIQIIRFSNPAAQRLLRRFVSDESKRAAYRTAVRFASQVLGTLLIIMVIFGVPNDLPPAILGIVGAGLSVVLKDFTVSFFDSRIRGVVAAYVRPADSPK